MPETYEVGRERRVQNVTNMVSRNGEYIDLRPLDITGCGPFYEKRCAYARVDIISPCGREGELSGSQVGYRCGYIEREMVPYPHPWVFGKRAYSMPSTTIVHAFCISFLYSLPLQNCTTAYLPLHAHLRLCGSSALSGSCFRNLSTVPSGNPTTTSALQVLSARVLHPLSFPIGPRAVSNGVVGSHEAWVFGQTALAIPTSVLSTVIRWSASRTSPVSFL